MENYQWDIKPYGFTYTDLYTAIINSKEGRKVDIKDVSFDNLLMLKSYMDIYFHVGELNKHVRELKT